jgi:hypothetical protein
MSTVLAVLSLSDLSGTTHALRLMQAFSRVCRYMTLKARRTLLDSLLTLIARRQQRKLVEWLRHRAAHVCKLMGAFADGHVPCGLCICILLFWHAAAVVKPHNREPPTSCHDAHVVSLPCAARYRQQLAGIKEKARPTPSRGGVDLDAAAREFKAHVLGTSDPADRAQGRQSPAEVALVRRACYP